MKKRQPRKKTPKTAKKLTKKAAARARVAKGTDKATRKSARKAKKKKKTYEHHPDHYNTSETYLIENLDEDLRDAWQKIRSFGVSLGEQKIYASGRAIMFSKKVCYFFVRPKKRYLEVVIFLHEKRISEAFKIQPASKVKFAHTFRLIHSDQVEGELTEAISEAYTQVPPRDGSIPGSGPESSGPRV